MVSLQNVSLDAGSMWKAVGSSSHIRHNGSSSHLYESVGGASVCIGAGTLCHLTNKCECSSLIIMERIWLRYLSTHILKALTPVESIYMYTFWDAFPKFPELGSMRDMPREIFSVSIKAYTLSALTDAKSIGLLLKRRKICSIILLVYFMMN